MIDAAAAAEAPAEAAEVAEMDPAELDAGGFGELDDELANLAAELDGGGIEAPEDESSEAAAQPAADAANPDPGDQASGASSTDEAAEATSKAGAGEPGSADPTHEVVTAEEAAAASNPAGAPGRDAGTDADGAGKPRVVLSKAPKVEREPLRAEGKFKYGILAWLYAKRYAPPAGRFVMKHMQAAWRQTEPKLGLAVRSLAKPLEDRPKIVRDSIGWLALWTMFNAAAVWAFVLFIREPPAPPAAGPPVMLRDDQVPQNPARSEAEPATDAAG